MKIYAKNNTLVVIPSGDVDHHSAQKLRHETDRMIESSGIVNIVFDLSNTSFMDSSGIGMIMGRYRKIKAFGGSIAVINADNAVRRIIGLSGLGNIVSVEKVDNSGKRCINEQNEN